MQQSLEQRFGEMPTLLGRKLNALDADKIAQAITQRIGGLVRDLRVSVDGLYVFIQGTASTYTNKQAVTRTALTFIGANCVCDEEITLTNKIEVH